MNRTKQTDRRAAPATRRPAPGLSDLLSLDLPRVERSLTPDGRAVPYRLNCDADEVERLKFAASNAADLLEDGIEVIGELLGHVGHYEPEEFDAGYLNCAGWLIAELAKCRRQVSEIEYIMERAVSTAGGGDDEKP